MSEKKLPTAADEARFWGLIEAAWAPLGQEVADLRVALAKGAADDPNAIESFIANLVALSADLSGAELTDLDRVEIQAVTDGSDDGFLYCRGFIVAMGKDFYDAVDANPDLAVVEDAECEDLCYFFADQHDDRFGEGWPATDSGISRESVQNKAGWA